MTEIKIDCKTLNEQIKIIDAYASVVVNGRTRDMIDGVVTLLDHILWALEEGEEISIEMAEGE